jgi:hypothetical protein
VVEVEPAQEHLVRFAGAAVLRDDHARHGLEDFARTHSRPRVEFGRADDALRGSHALADRVVPAAEHDDVVLDARRCRVLDLREHRGGHQRACDRKRKTPRAEA